MSEIPERAILDALAVQRECGESHAVDDGERCESCETIMAWTLEAALPALHESWEAEMVARVKSIPPLDPAIADSPAYAEGYHAGWSDLLRAIRGEPGDE